MHIWHKPQQPLPLHTDDQALSILQLGVRQLFCRTPSPCGRFAKRPYESCLTPAYAGIIISLLLRAEGAPNPKHFGNPPCLSDCAARQVGRVAF